MCVIVVSVNISE